MSDLSDTTQWYATYNEERGSFVVEAAGWEEGCPNIEYRFRYFIDPCTGHRLGAIDKRWLSNGYLSNDLYTFKGYRGPKEFEADVQRMMTEARQLAQTKQRDFFLCMLDLVKKRAVKDRREYAYILDYDTLFDIGPEDAYRW